jgi:hypothetical protein
MLGGENMRTQNFSILGLLFVSLSMVGLPTSASTPAEETVCDPLMAEGTTPGLYGLCIAFCEAHDLASEDYPVTDEELAALQENAPSGNILDAYNNIKKADDPDMPCIVVDSSCPCWMAEELAAIDGVILGVSENLRCDVRLEDGFARIDEFQTPVPGQPQLFTLAAATEQVLRCSYLSNQVPDQGTLNISPGQAAACVQQISDHCAMFGN